MEPTCPECEEAVDIMGVWQHQIVRCAACSAELELVQLDPPQFQLAPKIEDDFGE